MRPLILCLLVGVLAAADISPAQIAAAQAAYHQAGRAVVDQVVAKKVDVVQVEALVLTMEQHAVVLAKAYAAKHPAGAKLIAAVMAQVVRMDAQGAVVGLGPMKALPFAEIEKQWHDLGHFKTNPVGLDLQDEANEHFTDPLHTMIHPVMVLRAALDFQASKSDKDLQTMKSEMEEGLEQAEKTKVVLTK